MKPPEISSSGKCMWLVCGNPPLFFFACCLLEMMFFARPFPFQRLHIDQVEPHSQRNGVFTVYNATSIGCSMAAEINGGYLDPQRHPGEPAGFFSNDSAIHGCRGVYGLRAQADANDPVWPGETPPHLPTRTHTRVRAHTHSHTRVHTHTHTTRARTHTAHDQHARRAATRTPS